MVVPALVYVLWNLGSDGDLAGWAIPTATDIAFAVAVLAVISTHLPTGLRTFLLTLAVVDDLLAITVIALFYTDDLRPAVPARRRSCRSPRSRCSCSAGVHRRWSCSSRWRVVAWVLVHASGVHATVAGVLLGFTVPVLRSDGRRRPGLAEHLEHLVRPVSAGVAVPVFAFFAAGVTVGGLDGLQQRAQRPDRARHRHRARGRQDRSASPARRGCSRGSPAPTSTTS